MRAELVIGAVVASAASGCALTPPTAFPDGALPLDVAARVEGAAQISFGADIRVSIEAINGESELYSWRSGRSYVLLAPGTYTFDVRYKSRLNQAGLVQAAINIGESSRNAGTSRKLRFRVSNGHAYHIHYSDSPVRYFLDRLPIAEAASPAPWDPPWDATECVSRPPSPDILYCVRPDDE